jgi:hypothetical protein
MGAVVTPGDNRVSTHHHRGALRAVAVTSVALVPATTWNTP